MELDWQQWLVVMSGPRETLMENSFEEFSAKLELIICELFKDADSL